MKLVQLAVAGLLALVLAIQWLWPRSVPEPEVSVPTGGETVTAGADAIQGEPPELPPLSFFNEVGERPLFFEGRRPPPEEAEEQEVAEEPEPEPDAPAPQVGLTGILILEGERYALVKDESGKGTQRLRVGDEYKSWTVHEIDEDKLVLTNKDQKEEFLLWQYQPVLPPTQRAEKRAGSSPNPAARSRVQRPGFDSRRPTVRSRRSSSKAGE